MKTFRILVVLMLAVITTTGARAQNQNANKTSGLKTETIKVLGNCSSCKARIEKAAKIDGVSRATWDQSTKILTLVYNPSATSSDAVQKKIASVGHDTEKYRAPDEAYNKLDACCKYERKQ